MWFCVVIYPEEVLPYQEGIASYTWLHVTFAFLIVITVLYSAIAISLKRQNRALADSAPSLQQHALKKRRQAFQIAVVIAESFLHFCFSSNVGLFYVPFQWNVLQVLGLVFALY